MLDLSNLRLSWKHAVAAVPSLLISFILIETTLLLPKARAGEWGSSGGEFLKDISNPWFLKNVSLVKYCIEVDPSGFSASREKVELLLTQALKYWQREYEGEQILGIAKQKFQMTSGPCTGPEDIRFQFGYGALTTEQVVQFAAHGSTPQEFVAVTVRTEYDHKELRGKGFVFFGSDRGEHPYNNGQGVATNLWQHDGVLYRVLIHELGHIFGSPHLPGVPMGLDYPELVLKYYSEYRDVGEIPPFFLPRERYLICSVLTRAGWPIPVPTGTKCLILNFSDHYKTVEIQTLNESGTQIPWAKMAAREVRTSILDFPVRVVFSKEQSLFPVMPDEKSWNGPSRQKHSLYLDFPQELGGKSFLLDLTPGNLRVHTAVDGKIVFLLDSKFGIGSKDR